ncbi:sodium:proline symporter, partial [Helicobacter pylori]
ASTVILYDKFGKSFLDIYEIVPGFIVASIAIVAFSLFSSVRAGTKEAFETMLKEIESLKR